MRQLTNKPEWLVCTENADCIIVGDSTACFGGYGAVIAQASEADFRAATTVLEQEFCADSDSDGPIRWLWPEPASPATMPACGHGVCVQLPAVL